MTDRVNLDCEVRIPNARAVECVAVVLFRIFIPRPQSFRYQRRYAP